MMLAATARNPAAVFGSAGCRDLQTTFAGFEASRGGRGRRKMSGIFSHPKRFLMPSFPLTRAP
jgi:hypothetical protein